MRAGPVLLAGDACELREQIEQRAAARCVPMESVDLLDDAAIRRAGCVILVGDASTLHARALAVLAAGCLLLVPRLDPDFGLQDGLDHLEFVVADEAITLVESYLRAPAAFTRVRTWARIAARSEPAQPRTADRGDAMNDSSASST
jgi:hypothetical protein